MPALEGPSGAESVPSKPGNISGAPAAVPAVTDAEDSSSYGVRAPTL